MINRGVFDYLIYGSWISGVIPFLFSVIKFKTLNQTMRVLLFYLTVTVIMETASFFLTSNGVQNYALENTYTFIEGTCIFLMYYLQFKNPLAKKILIGAYLFFFILSGFLLIFMGAYNKPDNIINSLEAWMVLMFGTYYLYTLYSDLSIPKLTDYYFTWINVAIQLYFCVSMLIFFFNNYLEKGGLTQYYNIYSIHLIGNMLFNLLLTIGIWKTTPTQA